MRSAPKVITPYEAPRYIFKPPFATSIRPLITSPDVTLSLLHEINISFPCSKRLPTEILHHINEELHRPDVVLEDIRSTWTPVTTEHRESVTLYSIFFSNAIGFDIETRRYTVTYPKKDPFERSIDTDISCHVSSADLLYRLRCFFPEVGISSADGDKSVYMAVLYHNPSGTRLFLEDGKGAACIRYAHLIHSKLPDHSLSECFFTDVTRLVNAFFEVFQVGGRPLAYYHPSAIVDLQGGNNKRYIAVPEEICVQVYPEDDDYESTDPYETVYDAWDFVDQPDTDTLSFRSVLHQLNYDIVERRIDPCYGTTNLTTVISSALLFYRLLCKYTNADRYLRNVNVVHPVTSVWQVQLFHRETGACVLFLDDHGLFDIRADEDAEEVMVDIENLVEGLCSDVCTHPYGSTLAGTCA